MSAVTFVVAMGGAGGALATSSSLLSGSVSAPSPATSSAAYDLGRSLSVAHTFVEVDAADVIAGCVVSKLTLTSPARRLVRARLRTRDTSSPVERLSVSLVAVGDDAKGRRCRTNTSAEVTLVAQPETPQPGTRVRLAVEGNGFVIEGPGVVVPCRANERRVRGAVCVRSDTGRTMVGCVGDDQGQILISSRCST
jgi:hypothetical protein